jgi:hypothetical protein
VGRRRRALAALDGIFKDGLSRSLRPARWVSAQTGAGKKKGLEAEAANPLSTVFFLVAWGAIESPLHAPSSLEFCEASKKLMPRSMQAIFDRRSTPNHRPKTSLAAV